MNTAPTCVGVTPACDAGSATTTVTASGDAPDTVTLNVANAGTTTSGTTFGIPSTGVNGALLRVA